MEPPKYKLLTARKLRLAAEAIGRDRERMAAANAGTKLLILRPIITQLDRPVEEYSGLDWCLGDECR